MPVIEKNTTRHSGAGRNPVSLITNNIDIWSSATQTKKGVGRGSSKKLNLYGIKKLRELILELAVRGLLVPQDPNDEPASVLLEKITAEKERLVKDKKIKKQKALPEITGEEKPFEQPSGWEWVRLLDIMHISSGNGLTSKEMKQDGIIPVYGGNGVTGFHDVHNVNKRTLVIGRVGFYCGSIHITPEKAWITDNAFITTFSETNIDIDYLSWLLRATNLNENDSATAQPVISGRKVYPIVVCLPPKQEQHRIVTKVDELMTLCDQLEQQQENSITDHKILVEALLSALTNAADKGSFEESWQKIANHFDTLFTTEHSIDQLKQAILQLAVMGKLTSPESNDMPVGELIENIYNEQIEIGLSKEEHELLYVEYEKYKSKIINERVTVKARFICNFITKGTTPSKHELLVKGDIPFLKVYNIVENNLDFEYRPIFISNDVHNVKLKRSRVYPNDVIMNIVGPPLGKVAMINNNYPEWNMNQALAIFRPLGGILSKYIYYMLSTDSILNSVLQDVKGTAGQDNLSLEQCRNLELPIPSIQEQLRIVKKVDKLMMLYGQLKVHLSEARVTQLHLADTMAEQALN